METYFPNSGFVLLARRTVAWIGFGLLALLVMPVLLYGQEGASDGDSIHVEFSALSLGGTLRNWQYGGSLDRHTITVPNAARSVAQSYRGEPIIHFYDAAQPEDGAVSMAPVASVDMTGRSGKWLFVFLPAGAGGYRIHPIEDGTDKFRAGSWKVFNFSPDAMALKVADAEPFVITPDGGSYVFSNKQGHSATERVQVAIYRQKEWEIAYRSLWGVRSDSRSLVFLMGDGASDKITVRRFHQAVRQQVE